MEPESSAAASRQKLEESQEVVPPSLDGMDRFWLKFRNRRTEKEYMAYRTRSEFYSADIRVRWIVAMIHFAAIVRRGLKPVTQWPSFLLGFNAVVMLGEIWLIEHVLGVDGWKKWRTPVILSTRFNHALEGGLIGKYVGLPTRDIMSLFIMVGMVVQLVTSLGIRLPFRYHVPVQTLSTAFFIYCLIKGPCDDITTHGDTRSVIRVANLLDSLAHFILQLCFSLWGRTIVNWPELKHCLHFAIWMQLFGGLFLGSYMLWRFEVESRRSFILTLSYERRKSEQLPIEPTPLIMERLHVLVTFIVFAVCWRGVFELVPIVEKYGLDWNN